MDTLNVGNRVKVTIPDSTGWSREARRSMNGALGTVAEVGPEVDAWGHPREPVYTVTFDEPCAAWHSHSPPVTEFHFERGDLTLLDDLGEDDPLAMADSYREDAGR